MDWLRWLNDLGLPISRFPNLDAIILSVVVVAGAYGISWLAGSRAGPPIANWWRSRAGATDSRLAAMIRLVVRYGIAALLLFLIGNSAGLNPFALMIVAAGLGIATALLVFHLARGFGLGIVATILLSAISLFAATAGALGGMQPLVASLDQFGFTVGSRRFSLLAMLNFVIVAAVLVVVARIVNRLLVHSIGRLSSLDVSQRTLLQKLAGITVIAVAVLIGVDLLGIDLTALAFFSGAFGLAVGFGLQKTFGNLISGLILLMDRSVKPGDVIVVGDTFGTMNKIGVRAVSVVTRDGKEHLLPNEQLMTEPVENSSFSNRNVRLHVPVGVIPDSEDRDSKGVARGLAA